MAEPSVSGVLRRVRSPWEIGRLRLPHRIVMGSMHTGLEMVDDGGQALAAFYRERVESGAALVITGGLAVNSEARGGPDYVVLGDSAANRRLHTAVEAVHEESGFIAAQLFHAGRYAIFRDARDDRGFPVHPVAPSAVPWKSAHAEVPRALTEEEIYRTIDDFAAAATHARDLGFDAVEIMASEGYLINQFCSPLTNLRDDEWGGDSERRRRFAVEVTRAVCEAVDVDIPVMVRMSGDDLMEGSSTQVEVEALARAFVGAGARALSVGMGWHESSVPTVQASIPHGVWLGYAERIALAVEARPVPVIASNRLVDVRQAEIALQRGIVDAVALARPFLADPAIVTKSLTGDFDSVNTCIGCDQACIDRSLVFQPVSCLVNPRAGRELEFPLVREVTLRRIAVVGGGPAGIMAALDLAERGHHVTIFESAAGLGGQFALAARVPGKEDYARTAESAETRLHRLGASIRTGVDASAEDIRGYDGVIVATGVVPRVVNIPGADLRNVYSYERAIREGVPEGSVAIIGGGGIGVDVAGFLIESLNRRRRARAFGTRFDLRERTSVVADSEVAFARPGQMRPRSGKLVTIMRRTGRFGQGIGITTRWVALGTLRVAGVRMLTGLQYRNITVDGVEIEHDEGRRELVPGRSVIICAGQEQRSEFVASIAESGVPFEIVGGAREADAVDAVKAGTEGLEAARRITSRLCQ